MSTLDEKLQAFQDAQSALYSYLGVSRRDENPKGPQTDGLRYTHGGGNLDIPTAHPEVLDYRTHQWQINCPRGSASEEIQVQLRGQGWEPEDTVRFHLHSIWDGPDGQTHAVGMHLPKADELHYAHPDSVGEVEAGGRFFGDRYFLILDAANGQTELEDYKCYFE